METGFHVTRFSVAKCASATSVLIVMLACTPVARAESWWGPGVTVLAELSGYVFDWSPDGERLAYADDDGVWLLEGADLQHRSRLPLEGWQGGPPVSGISWSPDGGKLAFVSPRAGDDWGTIWLADREAARVVDLLPPEVSEIFASTGIRALQLGPWLDDRVLAFSQYCGPGCVTIHRVDVETKEYGHLCVASVDGGLHWSPSKDKVVVSGHNGALVLAHGKSFRSVSANGIGADCPTAFEGCSGSSKGPWFAFDDWSPDGARLLVTRRICENGSAGAGPGSGGLFLWVPGGSSPSELVPNATLTAWSPDGTRIAFILQGKPRYGSPAEIIGTDLAAGRPFEAYLGIMDADRRPVRSLLPLGVIDPEKTFEEWSLFRPVWAPDGRRLVFRDAENNLSAMNSDGSGQRVLVRRVPASASWSPDGKRMAIRVSRQPNFWVGAEAPYIVEID